MTSKLTPPVGKSDHVQGRHDSPITLVEYGDYECPYCGRAYPIVKRLQARLGERLQFVFRNFPLAQIHPNAKAAAMFVEAAALQGKFWEAHDLVFERQEALSPPDLLAYASELGLDVDEVARILARKEVERVRTDFLSGVTSGVNGTPAFFINGVRFDGDWGDEKAFEEALRRGGG